MIATETTNLNQVGKKRTIQKVAVLGSGIMGTGIACHFANIGVEVLMLDIVPFDLKDEDKNNPAAKNKIGNDSLKAAKKARLNPLYRKSFADRITIGNFDDNFEEIKDADLIIEAVIERLDIKKQIFEKVDNFRKKDSIVASNTSGIPIHMMVDGRSESFKKNFAGMHFFNPVRYLRLLEIIPTPHTDPEVSNFLMEYGDLHLGKETVLCKDTPAFIANRVGIYALVRMLELVKELDLTVEETDKLTGPVTGKPKTGTFRLNDLIGMDTTVKVKKGIAENCPDDEANSSFATDGIIEAMVEKGWYGDKSKQGFYKKTKEKDEKGKSIILALDLNTMDYRPKQRPKLASLDAVKTVDDLPRRLKMLYDFDDKGGQLVRQSSQGLFAYISNRIPEIADDLYQIDDALRAGFAWDLGPFQSSEIIGVRKLYDDCVAAGISVAGWVKEMLDAGHETFYKNEGGNRLFYHIPSKSYKTVPGTEKKIFLDVIRETSAVWKNSGTTLHDLGDGVLGLEFQTKMNSIGGEVLEGINKSIEIAETQGWKGLVIGNNGTNFSVGANVAMMLMLAVDQEWDELNFAIRHFQQTVARIRFSSIPVVVAPHAMTLGGGCEMTMHADQVVAAAETYIGLVEVGVGLVPGGGGTKEMALRLSDGFASGDVQLNDLQSRLLTIAQAKVATSAYEAYGLGILKPENIVSVNLDRRLKDAKTEVIRLYEEGYAQPAERTDIRVLGRTGLGMVNSGVYAMYAAGWASEHDMKVAKKVAWILCGGDLSGTQKVSESYLLDLEREAFLSLLGEQKTLQRMEHTLKTGKPLRN